MLAYKWYLAAGVGALVAFGASQAAFSTRAGQDDPSGGNGIDQGSFGTGIQTADHHRFTIPFAQSIYEQDGFGFSETVVKVANDSKRDIDVLVNWYYASAGALAGTSGPETIPAGESRLFLTHNPGENTQPYFIDSAWNGYRDTTHWFSGHAKVFVGSGTGYAKNATCTAALLIDPGYGFNGNAREVSELKVFRADDHDGDGHTDTRYKGD